MQNKNNKNVWNMCIIIILSHEYLYVHWAAAAES